MSQGIEGFQRLLKLFRSSSTWASGGLVAVPFVAGLANLSPPWPSGIVTATAIVQLVVLALAYQLLQGRSRRTINFMMALGIAVLLACSAAYLQQLSRHTYTVPTTEERFTKGTECTEDARTVFGKECPDLGMDALRTAEYEAERLWTAGSIDAVRLRLVVLWSLAYAALSWTLGAFFVFQMGKSGVPLPRGMRPDEQAVQPSPETLLEPDEPATPAAPVAAMDGGNTQWQSAEPPATAAEDWPGSASPAPSTTAPPPPVPPPPAPPAMSLPDEAEGDRLLGGHEPPATAGAEPPEAAPSAPEARWINARLEDHPQGESLKTGQAYTLAFGIDAQAVEDLGAGSSVPSQVVVPQDQAEVTLTVQLDSTDFRIGDATRPLRVLASGLSSGRARFDITPLHDGPGTLVATFHKDGNFVQQMTLTLQVGATTTPSPQATRAGRPLLVSRALRKRDVGISVVPAPGGGFDCTVWGATQGRARLPIKDTELADAIEQLRKALMNVVMRKAAPKAFPFQDAIDIAPEHRDAALLELAKAGYLLYRLLFHHPAADLQCKAIGDWLRKQALDANTQLTLQVIGEGFPVPWALLYLADGWDETTVSWDGFLGMRHVVEQIPLQQDMSTADSLIEEQPAGLAVSLNLNTGIDAQMKLDVVQRQASYWDGLKSTRKGLRVTTRTQASELLGALASADTDDQILYLFCHATTVGLGGVGGPNGSSLTLSNDKAVTLGDLTLMASSDRKLKGNPLVFINACESGELSPLFYNGFVPYFMSKGARGVIGTECKMPALFAAEWARRFFDDMLAGKPLGQTFLDLRRGFLLDHGNPLGLLYGLHSNADVQLVDSTAPLEP